MHNWISPAALFDPGGKMEEVVIKAGTILLRIASAILQDLE